MFVVGWDRAAAGTPLWPLLSGPLAVACLVACALAADWAHSRRRLLVHD